MDTTRIPDRIAVCAIETVDLVIPKLREKGFEFGTICPSAHEFGALTGAYGANTKTCPVVLG